ncbi:peptidylprolyl isomerase [Sphingomonas sp. M1-B02]|uniref:peptidylprolyl isomerase n=1 Tax=Sphingomonas sp. M1-B02 TaxID=3114300 RepID=UPI002240D9A1|nr:peptidylprolyl isomerase [Sphingomonas sp. S6-11]UZK65407.1 peptidylprolyl isomerase [Sphingomonas sp. S6-11]
MLKPLIALTALAAGVLAIPAIAQTAPAAPLPSDPAPSDWRDIPDDEIMAITFRDGRQVFVRLAARFAPGHVANLRQIAKAHWWDGTSVYRVQENWVTQWGGDEKTAPPEIVARPPAEFEIHAFEAAQRLTRADGYSAMSGVTADGWPIASDGKAAWLTHCYGMVGVARDQLPDTGAGTELFTPIGQSARRLDRNYTVVGRIVEGMHYMSAMPRSSATMGVYATAAERTPIASVRLASQLPEDERPRFQYRAADNERYAAWIRLREQPAAPTVATGLEVCDLPVGVRRKP